MIGEKNNMEDVWLRDLTVCVLATLEGKIKWINRFTSKDVVVNVPFYYSMTGDERFLLDTFTDDITSNSRYVELNTDQIPRGHITLKGVNVKSDEFANPNVWLKKVIENKKEIRRALSVVRSIPVVVSYDLNITLASELDSFKCTQAILNTMWLYKYMYFEHNLMYIDAVINIPDESSIEIARDKGMDSDNSIIMSISFEVHTYYPAFRPDRYGESDVYDPTSGMRDPDGTIKGEQPTDFYADDATVTPGDGTDIDNRFHNSTKRSKWVNNILRTRGGNYRGEI